MSDRDPIQRAGQAPNRRASTCKLDENMDELPRRSCTVLNPFELPYSRQFSRQCKSELTRNSLKSDLPTLPLARYVGVSCGRQLKNVSFRKHLIQIARNLRLGYDRSSFDQKLGIIESESCVLSFGFPQIVARVSAV